MLDYEYENQNRKMPDYMFGDQERETIIKCINILTSDYYFDQNEFRSLTATDDKSRFIKVAGKLKDNRELEEDDAHYMIQAVVHVAMYPTRHRDEIEKQFDVKLFQLNWLASHIDYAFDLIFVSSRD